MIRRIALTLVAVVLALPLTAAQAAPVPTEPTLTSKVLVIVLENHSLGQIKAGAPYTQSLADQYGQATHMTACAHPSKPNYACYTAGSKMGLSSDSAKRVKGASVFGATIKAGRTAKTMAEGMGTDRCRHTSSSSKSGYVEKHNPQEFFSDETALCEKYNFDYGRYGASDIAAGKLGNVEFLIPNQCNNAHNCSLGTFDKWLKAQMARVFAGPDWTSGKLTVIITADEDDKKSGNVIPLIVVNPNLSHKVVTTPLTAYSLNRLLTNFGGALPLRGGATAPDMAAAFGLLIG